MFGLMTVARHEREMTRTEAQARAEIARLTEESNIAKMNAKIVALHYDDAHSFAMRLAADLTDLQRRYAPMPIPDDIAPGEGSVGDGDAEWTPTALAAKAKAVR
jgi:hypothetical protein